jgi:hypothetical protein
MGDQDIHSFFKFLEEGRSSKSFEGAPPGDNFELGIIVPKFFNVGVLLPKKLLRVYLR